MHSDPTEELLEFEARVDEVISEFSHLYPFLKKVKKKDDVDAVDADQMTLDALSELRESLAG